MAHGLTVAALLLVALLVGTAVLVVGVSLTLKKVNRGAATASWLVRRAKLLSRAEGADLSLALVAEIEAATTSMLTEVEADHMKTAVQRELECVQMARLALERGDPTRARAFLGRVGRRMVSFEVE